MKPYVKPQLFIESYELSQHVAKCGWDINASVGSCTASWDPDPNSDTDSDMGFVLFSGDLPCTVTPAQREEYCYTTGTDGNNLFNS